MAGAVQGYRRADGRAGVRNHVLVLPSVVCASHAGVLVAAETDAIAITHQHGCLHVGDDLAHTSDELFGAAVSPNVSAALVMSLGCETLNGRRLADRIATSGARVALVGIQQAGGTRRAIDDGRRVVTRLLSRAETERRLALDPAEIVVGIDAADDPLTEPLAEALGGRGFTVRVAPAGLRGAEAHVSLTSGGASLIVSLPAPDEGPIGFAVAPVLAVARGAELHRALADDFDCAQEPGESPAGLAERVVERAVVHAEGELTASELRGARDFVLVRLAVTM